MLIFTAYTKFALSFLVSMLLGVNSLFSDIHVIVPSYSLMLFPPKSAITLTFCPIFMLES